MEELPAIVEWVEAGDQAFARGSRAEGVRAWRAALRAAEAAASPGPTEHAVIAMAHLRLVHVEGNFGPLWHEPAWNRALADCPPAEAICAMALADRELLVPTFAGGDPGRVPRLVAPWSRDPRFGPLVTRRRHRADAGWPEVAEARTWSAHVLFSHAPLSGLGAGVRFRHPDVGWAGHRVEASVSADASGTWAVVARGSVRAEPGWAVALGAGDGPAWRWQDDGVTVHQVGVVDVYGGAGMLGLSSGVASHWAWIDGEDLAWAAGPRASLSGRAGNVRASAWVEAQGGSYAHLGAGGQLAARQPVGVATLAARLGLAAAPLPSSPWWRWPAAGGTSSLRGLPSGRARAPVLNEAQLELRVPVWGPLGSAVFVDTALADAPYWTVGAGLRLRVPPGDDADVRIDVAYTSTGEPGLVVGFGEAF